ncbi:helix-turn-helix domain protein [Bacteroides helcogenes P 36-108]|uniref:Helix-turn-helix domain protein n=2 Tax=Bacteroides helcogenes TaxID=290053 RepID=E6SN39_BACT6|nr:helix-turn-helix domain protein [Bacteroides helcogenes P 36-108]
MIMCTFIQMEKSNIYIGEIIKDVMIERQVTKAELARRLNVKPQSVDYMLTRKSIDTDTLYNVSKALDYDFALLYSIHREQTNFDEKEQEYRLSSAKVLVELELKPEDIVKLNLKRRIADILK